MAMRALFLVPICFMAFLHCIAARSDVWSAEKLPHPFGEFTACGQKAPSPLCDPDGFLGDGGGSVVAALQALEADYAVPSCGGYEMAVAVVQKAEHGDVEALAQALLQRWGVGKAACHNGILLALAVDDREMYIATGRGAEEHLPHDALQRVVERMKPVLRQGDYAGAVEQATSDVARLLAGETVGDTADTGSGWFIAAFICVMVACGLRGSRRQRRYLQCKQALTRLEQERAEFHASKYQVQSCAICLEVFGTVLKRETRLLACGHTFHRECVAEWQKRSMQCPVCRQVHGGEPACAAAEATAGVARMPSDEYNFRLHRTRHLYPEFVSQDMVNRWSSANCSIELTADTSFIRASPNYVDPSSSSSSYSSGDFGGGGGCGGGGAGGSW